MAPTSQSAQEPASLSDCCYVGSAITSWLFRIRAVPKNRLEKESALLRYKILNTDWPAYHCKQQQQDHQVQLQTEEARLQLDTQTGVFQLADQNGAVRVDTAQKPAVLTGGGFKLSLKLSDAERLYGLGDETREQLNKRGHAATMWVTNVSCYSPTPWLASSRGWGMFVATTFKHRFDIGVSQSDQLLIHCLGGMPDVFLVVGDDLVNLLDRGTQLVGRPKLLPLAAYGLTFVCNQQANAREMLDDCLNLRREQIPCDTIGLEPGWMSQNYDASVNKQWHPERFFVPPWAPIGEHTFLGAAKRMGFRTSLWLCCDYDVSECQEHEAGPQEPTESARHADDFEQDMHFQTPHRYMDQLTQRGEPWFEHLKKFVDQGASAFKMDGAWQVSEHPDRLYANGMRDAEMHNLYPTLMNKQMCEGYESHTGRRAMIYSSGGYAGIGRFAATWAGDTGGGPKPLVSLLNHGLSGHSNTSCDMDVFSPAGIHFGFLQPWSQVCSWAYWRHPWLLGDQLLPLFRKYAQLRYRLLPYIYSLAWHAATCGMPMVRAMPLAFADDPRSDELLYQYMFGDAFLTGAFTHEYYLPAGDWIDYWTDRPHRGPCTLQYVPPANCGGPLFVRAGSIIPYWPLMQYVGQVPVDAIELHVYPGPDSEFTLYEDDGQSLAYRTGQYTTTRISQQTSENKLSITIHPTRGQFSGFNAGRKYTAVIHTPEIPKTVRCQGRTITEWHSTDGLITLPNICGVSFQQATAICVEWSG